MSTSLPIANPSSEAYKPRRPTASEVLQEEGVTDWSDKHIMITGASAGIGIETARALAKVGAQLILPVRDLEKGQKVADDINASTGGKSKITLLALDLSSLQSVRDFAAEFLKLKIPLNILILNAGIMAVPQEMKTKDGFDAQFGTNHLAHFLLFELLKEKLLQSSTKEFNSRVVILSSGGHQMHDVNWDDFNFEKTPYVPFHAYGQSKTANILMAREIEKRYGNQGLHANAVHPGVIGTTELGRHLDPTIIQGLMVEYGSILKSSEQGAGTTIWAACSKEFEGKGGEYLEDCSHSCCLEVPSPSAKYGYAAYAYNEENAKRLYDISLKLVEL